MSNYESDHPFEDTAESRRRRERSERELYRDSPRRKRRWPWVLLFLLALVLLLPNLIGWLGLQQKALDYALSDFNGKVTIEKASLGWFQPVKLSNVQAVDPQGNPLFSVESVTTTNSLYRFLTSSDYGEANIYKPVAHVVLRPDGSNIEDAVAKYMEPAPEPKFDPETASPVTAKPLPRLKVNVIDGQALVASTTDARSWRLDQLNAIAETSTEQAPLIVDAQCRVTTAAPNQDQPVMEHGGVSLVSHIDSGSEILSFGSADVNLETVNLPLSLAAPILQRAIGPASTAGNMNGKIQASYSAASNSVAMNVEQLDLTNVAISAPELLGTDHFALQRVSANGVIQASPTIISANQFKLVSDVGNINAEGSFDVNQVTDLANSGQLLDTPFSMDGELDLAALIRMLPSTLQLHEDLVVNSGSVTFQAGSHSGPQGRKLVVNLDTANLNANRGAQSIVWAKPLRLVGTVREANGKLSLENVSCISDFLEVSGDADSRTAAFVAKGDLSKLMERVEQFVDLQGTKIGGVLDGKFGWQVTDNTNAGLAYGIENMPIQIGGEFTIDQPIIEMPGMPRWQQPKMLIRLSGSGQSQTGNKLRLDNGGVQIDIGNERLVASLAQPVADAFTNETWVANCHATGSMNGWLGHVQNFVDLGDIQAGGALELTCGAALNSQSLLLSNIQYNVDQLAFNGYGVKIREPQATGTGVVGYDLASGAISLPDVTLNSSSVSARGQQLKISFPSNMRVDGNVGFKADVNKMADWFELSPEKDSVFWFGAMEGTVQLASNENGIGGRVKATVTDLVAANQVPNAAQLNQQGQIIQASAAQGGWQELWREPTVGINGDLSMANDFNAIGFQNLSLDSSGLKASANGSLSDLAGQMLADVSGTWVPDWQKINSLLAAYAGDAVKFAGQRQHQFVVRGPIFEAQTQNALQAGKSAAWVPASLQAAASFGWEQGEVLGLPVGKSDLELNVAQSIGQVKTNGIPFAGGAIQFAPQLDLRGEQPLLVMGQTRLVNNVALQPETARQWLKFVAPLAADATSAQGNFTVDVGQAKVPLLDPTKMELGGAVRLSNIVIGAGPTAQQLLGTVKQLRTLLKPDSEDRDLQTWLQMEEQTIPVQVKDGRVYHDKLRLTHKDLTIQTSGSVGIDQTLNMVASIPIADDWIDGKSYLAPLQGKSISIPIRGTVSKPVLDKSGLQQLSQNLVRNAAGNALNKAVGEKLTPKVDEFKNKLNGKFGEELNKLQGKLGEKLGNGLLPNLQGGAPQGGAAGQTPLQPQSSFKDQINNKIEDEVKKGIGKLFGK